MKILKFPFVEQGHSLWENRARVRGVLWVFRTASSWWEHISVGVQCGAGWTQLFNISNTDENPALFVSRVTPSGKSLITNSWKWHFASTFLSQAWTLRQRFSSNTSCGCCQGWHSRFFSSWERCQLSGGQHRDRSSGHSEQTHAHTWIPGKGLLCWCLILTFAIMRSEPHACRTLRHVVGIYRDPDIPHCGWFMIGVKQRNVLNDWQPDDKAGYYWGVVSPGLKTHSVATEACRGEDKI